MTKQQSNAFEVWLSEAKRFRALESESTADFFQHLAAGEVSGVWKMSRAGYATFLALLSGENLCRPERFTNFKALVVRFGWEQVRALGVDQLRQILYIPDIAMSQAYPKQRASDAAVQDMLDSLKRNEVPVSEQQARAIGRKHYVPESKPRTSQEQRIVELEKEVVALKAENAALKKQIAHLSGDVVGKVPAPLARRKSRNLPGAAQAGG